MKGCSLIKFDILHYSFMSIRRKHLLDILHRKLSVLKTHVLKEKKIFQKDIFYIFNAFLKINNCKL